MFCSSRQETYWKYEPTAVPMTPPTSPRIDKCLKNTTVSSAKSSFFLNRPKMLVVPRRSQSPARCWTGSASSRVGGRKIVNEHHDARAVAAKIETERGPLPVNPTVAGILGVQHPLPVTQTGDPGAAGLLPQDISVGQAPFAARFFYDLSEPVRDRTEKPVPCVNDLVRGVLSTLRGWITSKRRTASRRRIRLREGRFGAPRDEGQNQEGGPHHSLHRVLHSRESCSTVTTKLCGFIFAPARTQGAIISIMILMPANALSISLCTRSTSDLRNVCSCRGSGESISSPSIEFEVRRKTEDKILSASTSIWVTGPRFLADRGSGDGASRRNAGFPPAFVASTQEYL